MILVFLLIFLIIFILITFLQIKINVKYIKLSNVNKYKRLDLDYFINIGLYLFGKIRVIEIQIDKKTKKNKNFFNKLSKKMEWKPNNKNKLTRIINRVNYKIDVFKFNLNVGTGDAAITAYLVAVIASLISILMKSLIKDYNNQNYYFDIKPIYSNDGLIDLELSTIIYIKTQNIIYVAQMFLKRKLLKSN